MNNKFLSFFNRYRFVRRLFGGGGGMCSFVDASIIMDFLQTNRRCDERT